MFNKLSAALVAMSLVAIVQPASAQSCWGVTCPPPPDKHDQITIKSIDGKNVLATDGKSYTLPKPGEVSIDGVQVAPEELKPGMVCDVNRGPLFNWKNIFTCKSK
jgi:hypothetical protein